MKIKIMIISVIVLIVLLAVGRDMILKPTTISGVAALNKAEKIDPGTWQPAPPVTLTTLDGQDMPLELFRGKVTLLTFWATWCPSCLEEFPALLKLVRDFNGNVVLVMVSIDDDKQKVIDFLKGFEKDFAKEIHGPSVVMTWDENHRITTDVFNTMRYPETIILSRDLRMARKVVGAFDWSREDVAEFLKTLISFNS